MRGVIVCAEPQGAVAGLEIFAKGGNAIDAAIAGAFAQCVANPLGVGIGGTAALLVHKGATGESYFIDAHVSCPSLAVPDVFLEAALAHEGKGKRSEAVGRYIVKDDINQYGYKSVMVPGFVRGMDAAWQGFGGGKIAWGDLFQPAIRLAVDGFPVYPYLAKYYAMEGPARPGYPDLAIKAKAFPETGKLLYKDGRPFRYGERMTLTDMGATLEKIADGGADVFYTGSVGQAIAADFSRNGGLLRADDLADYEAEVREVVRGAYRGYEVVGSPPADRGVTIIQMLQILESFDLHALGWNTPDYVDLLARVQRASFADGAYYLADPRVFDVPVAMLASKEHAREWVRRIESGGDETFLAGRAATPPAPISEHTTHITAMDDEGNVASFTHSIGNIGASGIITPGLGFVYNNFLGHYNPVPGYINSIGPGKRFGGTSPMLLLKDGRPFLAIGSSGGSRLVSGIMQSIVNVIDHDMGVGEAVAVPRFHCEEKRNLYAEPGIFAEVIDVVEQKGYTVQRAEYMGCNQAILSDWATGTLTGGTDPRGGRGIAYWDG